jgi:hypothetical protein
MKLSKQNIKSLLAVFILSTAVTFSANAQCAAAKEGIKKLAPYMHNGKVNAVTVILDEPSEIHLSIYKGLNYKFQIGSEAALGKVTFRILDEYKKEIYNSATATDPESWIFFSNQSQNLIVEIYPVEKGKQGCAYLVVGMQQPKNNAVRNL